MQEPPTPRHPSPLPREPGPDSDRAVDRLRAAVGRSIHLGLPPGTSRGELARLVTARLRGRGTTRELWADARVGPSGAAFRRWLTARRPTHRPSWLPELAFRVVLVGHGSAALATRASVDAQGHDDVTIVGAVPTVASVLESAASVEPDEWLLFLHEGDLLEPGTFDAIGRALGRDPTIGLVTWDDARIAHRGPTDPRIRPSWSPDLLLTAPYLHRAFSIKGSVVHGAAQPTSGADDPYWDLLLRSELDTDQTHHISRVLSLVVDRVDAVSPAGAGIVQAELERRSWPALASSIGGRTDLEWRMRWPTVSVVVPSPHNRPLLTNLLRDLQATEYPDLEVVAVDNREVADRAEWYDQAAGSLRLRTVWWDEPFNYSAVNNAGAAVATGEVLVFLNDDTELPDPTWLKELVGWATRDEIGAAGAQLIDPDGLIQHGGVVLGLHGFAEHLFRAMEPEQPSLIGPVDWTRNATAVTGACVAITRDRFQAAGGFDERFRLTGSDVLLGLDVGGAGLRIVCSAAREIRHLESASRGGHDPLTDVYRAYWEYRTTILRGDRCSSPNLSRASGRPRLVSRAEPSAAELLARAVHRPNDHPEPEPLATDDDRPLLVVVDHDDPHHGTTALALAAADRLANQHGVRWRLGVMTSRSELLVRIGIEHWYPGLTDCRVDRWLPDEPIEPGPAPVVLADIGAAEWVSGDRLIRTGSEPWAEPSVWLPGERDESERSGRVLVASGAGQPALADIRASLPDIRLVAFQAASTSSVVALGPLIGPAAAAALVTVDAALIGRSTPPSTIRSLAVAGVPLVATGSFDPGVEVAAVAPSMREVGETLDTVLTDPATPRKAADQAFSLATAEADRLHRLVDELAAELQVNRPS